MTDAALNIPSEESLSTPEAPRSRALWLAIGAGWIGVALAVFSLGFFPLRTSTDEWWHLKTGRWIVEHDYEIPQKDVFTYTAAEYDWDNHEWLSQVGMYLLWQWGEDRTVGGWRAVILLKALILVATYLLLGRFLAQRAGGGWRGHLIAIFLVLLAAAVGKRMFWPRPPIVTNFFFVFFLYVMWLHRSGRLRTHWLLALPLLMPLWANLHGGFLVGGVVVAAYFAAEVAEWAGGRWIARRSAEELRPSAFRVRVYLGLGVLCGLGSLVNPFGYKLYLLPGRVMECKLLLENLGEMMPADIRYVWSLHFLLAFLAVGAGVLVTRSIRGRARAGLVVGVAAVIGLSAILSRSYAREVLELIANEAVAEDDLFLFAPAYALLLLSVAFGAGLLAAVFLRLRSREWPPLADLLLAAFFAWQALSHMRHMLLFGLAGAPLAAWMLRGWWMSERPGLAGTLRWSLAPASIFLGLWLIFFPGEGIDVLQGKRGMSQFNQNQLLFDGEEMLPRFGKKAPPLYGYPVEAADFILSAKLPPRMFNCDNLAGYLVWALSPEHYKVFTDSRFDIFGEDFFLDAESVRRGVTAEMIQAIFGDRPDLNPGYSPWTEIVEKYGINWLFLDKGEKIIPKLKTANSGWARIYKDDVYEIWLKRTPENHLWVEKYEQQIDQ